MINSTIKYVFKNLLFIVGIIFLIFFFTFKIYFPISTNHGESISVPNLIGMEIDELNDWKLVEYLLEKRLKK